jgi:hypothetical protein
MDNQAYYTATQIIRNAANDNTTPKKLLWQRLLKISLLIAPFVAWFLWTQ